MKLALILVAAAFGVVCGGTATTSAWAAEDPAAATGLDQKIRELATPENELPLSASREQIYAVQTRYSPLSMRHEVAIQAAQNLASENPLVTRQVGLAYRFHLTDRWSLGLAGAYSFNRLSDWGQRLIDQEQRYPDISYPRWLAEAAVTFNMFYGKFRLSMDHVLYFDNYLSLGGGVIDTDRGRFPLAVADLGFAFWIGRIVSIRAGVKDDFHYEVRRKSEGMVHDFAAHIDVGVMLGGGTVQ